MSTPKARVLVFQPLFTLGAPLDYRMLGFQFWIADQFTAIGLEGASALCRNPDPSDLPPELIGMHPPTQAQIRDTLAAHQARFGVVSTFAVLNERPFLHSVRLYEARRGHPLRAMQRLQFDGDTDYLPAAAHVTFIELAKRIGYVLGPSTWEGLFGTSDPVVASNYFTALGCYAACDQGFVIEKSEDALRAVISCIRAGMEPAKELLPLLVGSLLSSGSADTDTARAAVEAAREIVGTVPPSWHHTLAHLGLHERSLLN